ncbi:MAG: hypothetical protein HY865_09635 [Chloroflexi bacterium]|nr:hypothetical protein [Chloroflexota bacterium]
MPEEKLSTKPSIDTTDFKTGIAEMNREMRVLESGFRASSASMGDWASNATGLESRIKTLSSVMDIQKQKVEATRAEYERVKAEKGENSRAAQELEIKLNKETETLGKMGVELQNTEAALNEMETGSDEAGESVDELGNSTDEAGGKMEGFKSVLGGVGVAIKVMIGVVLGLVAAVVSVAGVVGGLVFSTASASANLVDMSTKTGISTTRLQELDYISHQVGTSLDTITGAQAKLVRSMASGADGTGAQSEAFKKLGVDITDAQGNLRDTQDVFAETIDALGRIENPAQRDALAMDIFGKSAQELNPLIKAGSDELGRLADKAHEVGAVMSEEDVAAMEAFDDTLASLKDGLKGTLGTLATAFLPGFQAVFDQVGGYLKQFTDIVRGADGDFGKIAEGLTGLVTQIATDVAAQAPQMLSAGLAIVKSILDAIISALPSMLSAGIEILKALIEFIISALPSLLDAGIQILLFLVDALIQNLPMLIEAALQAIITLANGLTQALPTMIPAIIEAVILIVNTLIENLPMLVDAALQLILALTMGLIAALPILIGAIPQIVDALLNALLEALPLILGAAGEMIGMLVVGIIAAVPLVVNAIGRLIDSIVNTLKKLPGMAVSAGKNFIQGLIDGMLSAGGALYDTVMDIVNNIVDTVTGADGLQEESPSKVGRGIGRNFIGSLGIGGMEVVRDVEQAFVEMTGRFSTAAAGGMAGAGFGGAGNSVNSEHYAFYAPVTIGAGASSLGETVKGRRF